MARFYCKYCGAAFPSVQSLTACNCSRHPDGPHRGKHALYEGSEKARYVCKYCGTQATSLLVLTGCFCSRHPDGPHKGKHSPAL